LLHITTPILFLLFILCAHTNSSQLCGVARLTSSAPSTLPPLSLRRGRSRG
jgi:hypothetical protein